MKTTNSARSRLRNAARRIAANRGEQPANGFVALRKILIQERRDWRRAGAFLGWKRGELFEWLAARTTAERNEEWGDVGYYVAQTWVWLWWFYAAITSPAIIARAVEKFERRANAKD